jgi:hypothetical protein
MEAQCGRCFLLLDYMPPYHVHICFPQTSIRVLHSSILSSTHSLLQYIFAYNGYAHCLMWRLGLSSPFRGKNTQPSSSLMLLCISFCFMQCLTYPYNVSHIFFLYSRLSSTLLPDVYYYIGSHAANPGHCEGFGATNHLSFILVSSDEVDMRCFFFGKRPSRDKCVLHPRRSKATTNQTERTTLTGLCISFV